MEVVVVVAAIVFAIINHLVTNFAQQGEDEELFVPEQATSQAPKPVFRRRRPSPPEAAPEPQPTPALPPQTVDTLAIAPATPKTRRRRRFNARTMRQAIVAREVLNRPRAYDS